MAGTAGKFEEADGRDRVSVLGPIDAREEDCHWQRSYWREHYYQPGLDYEDYAPAYCVGYIGYAQYGGAFEDAETWLLANWVRIKGDSRLGLNEARLAIRSAWERLAQRSRRTHAPIDRVGLLRRRLRMPAYRLAARLMR